MTGSRKGKIRTLGTKFTKDTFEGKGLKEFILCVKYSLILFPLEIVGRMEQLHIKTDSLKYDWTITRLKISNISSYKLLLDMKLKLLQL